MRIPTAGAFPLRKLAANPNDKGLRKSPTGIRGLDEVTGGGLPAGRPTLVCGGTGCGKTLLAMEFLVHGASEYGEPGVFMAFEETAEELTQSQREVHSRRLATRVGTWPVGTKP